MRNDDNTARRPRVQRTTARTLQPIIPLLGAACAQLEELGGAVEVAASCVGQVANAAHAVLAWLEESGTPAPRRRGARRPPSVEVSEIDRARARSELAKRGLLPTEAP